MEVFGINISESCVWGEYILIFVCVGSRDYQFDRLIEKVDSLVGMGVIKEPVFAQIGCTKYTPKYIEYKNYLTKEEFDSYQNDADLIITHGGTGAIVSGLKRKKKIIAVPRLKLFFEHTDDHQLQVVDALARENYILKVLSIDDLEQVYKESMEHHFLDFQIESNVLNVLRSFMEV